MRLRRFLFLDTDAVKDYLGQIEGAIAYGDQTQTDTSKRGRGGQIGYGPVGVNLGSEGSTATTQNLVVNDAALFQRLYDALEGQGGGGIQQLDAFDPAIWEQLRKGEVLEVDATIRFPTSMKAAVALAEVSALFANEGAADLGADYIGLDVNDPKMRFVLDLLRARAKSLESEPVPLMFEASLTPDLPFSTSLPRQYLRCGLTDLQGEATVFGTVQRLVPDGQTLEVFSVAPALSSFAHSMPNLSNEERNAKLKDMAAKFAGEVLAGPGVIVTPIAIYR